MVCLIKFINDKYCTAFRSRFLVKNITRRFIKWLSFWDCSVFCRLDYTVTSTNEI